MYKILKIMNPAYPIGEFKYEKPSKLLRDQAIEQIAEFPAELKSYLANADAKWDNTYREGSWTAAQVLHHLVDSHVNAFCRMKLCLADPGSDLRAYEEKEWTKLNSTDEEDIHPSLLILEGIHFKMAKLLRNCSDQDFKQELHHPEYNIQVSLNWLCMSYAWHGQHHLAHLKLAFGDL